MYISLAFILASLPFLTVALSARVPSSRGIAVPITKRGSCFDGAVDTSELMKRVKRTVALDSHRFLWLPWSLTYH